MDYNFDEIQNAIKKIKDAKNATEKEDATSEFWKAAIDAFNENLAGDIELADGRIVTVSRIEL